VLERANRETGRETLKEGKRAIDTLTSWTVIVRTSPG
jgi:hypothetical protein